MFWINLQTLLFVAALAAVIFSAAAYSGWMKEHYGCMPRTLSGRGAVWRKIWPQDACA